MNFGFYINRQQQNYIENLIQELISNHIHTFILYPYGEVSEFVSPIINKYNGTIKYYIDNYKNDGKFILSIEQAIKNKMGNEVILICNINEKYYNEIRENIYRAFPKDKIIDLFPKVVMLEDSTNIEQDIKYLKSFVDEVQL